MNSGVARHHFVCVLLLIWNGIGEVGFPRQHCKSRSGGNLAGIFVGQTNRRMDGTMDRHTDIRTDGQTEGRKDCELSEYKYKKNIEAACPLENYDRPTDRPTDQPTDG